jgi:hypothetical protein
MLKSTISSEALRKRDEVIRIGERGVCAAQERNRQLGIEPMTDYLNVEPETGRVIAANHKKRVKVGPKHAIVMHNQWISTVDGEHHQVALDFFSDSSSLPDASPECQVIIDKLFSGANGTIT